MAIFKNHVYKEDILDRSNSVLRETCRRRNRRRAIELKTRNERRARPFRVCGGSKRRYVLPNRDILTADCPPTRLSADAARYSKFALSRISRF